MGVVKKSGGNVKKAMNGKQLLSVGLMVSAVLIVKWIILFTFQYDPKP